MEAPKMEALPERPDESAWGVQADDEPPQTEADLSAGLIAETVPALMQRLGIIPSRDDVVLIGDGSGQFKWKPGGWAGVLIDRRTNLRKIMTGAVSDSEITRLEFQPYLWLLDWHLNNVRRYERGTRPIHCHIITDNLSLVQKGRFQGGHSNNAQRLGQLGPWYAAIMAISREGAYALQWHHTGRDQVGLNMICDHLSRFSRTNHTRNITMAKAFPTLPSLSVYAVNPEQPTAPGA